MNAVRSKPNTQLLSLAFILAVITTIAYLLIGFNLLPIGNFDKPDEGGAIIFVAAGCYLLGGLLIFAKRRWLWIIGILINALVMTFYFSMYHAQPDILLSAGGLITKIVQILLEVTLLLLLIRSWVKKGQ